MTFFKTLEQQTLAERSALVATPIIQACLHGQVSLPSYIAFLTQAYHHVRHTVPLLQACAKELSAPTYEHLHWLLPALEEYVLEEQDHDEWILNDLQACGLNRERIRQEEPSFATQCMVSFAYDQIQRRHPLGFLGMVHVLEGTSVALALLAADQIQKKLRLPSQAFSYLRSHGTLDIEHTAYFQQLVDQITQPDDQRVIVQAAKNFFRLYANIFRDLPWPQTKEELVAI